jgi:hypothetical protein
MRYLKMKNDLWFKMARELEKDGNLGDSLFILEDESDRFYDLAALYFKDEGGYERALFIPVPLMWDSKKRIVKKIKKHWGDFSRVSREWHDNFWIMPQRPEGFFPPEQIEEYPDEEHWDILQN